MNVICKVLLLWLECIFYLIVADKQRINKSYTNFFFITYRSYTFNGDDTFANTSKAFSRWLLIYEANAIKVNALIKRNFESLFGKWIVQKWFLTRQLPQYV